MTTSPPGTSSKPLRSYVLPFPLPTWNRILALSLRERMKLKVLVKLFTCTSIACGNDWPTSMEYRSKQRSTDWCWQEYWKTIGRRLCPPLPSASQKPSEYTVIEIYKEA